MSFTPTSGQYAAAQLGTGAIGSNTQITVPGINWSLDWDNKSKDVSNFRDGRSRTGTLPDYTLTLTLVWDAAANPLLAANGDLITLSNTSVARGSLINATLFTDQAQTNSKAWFGPYIVSKVSPKNSGVEDVVMLDVTCEANGAITPPST
jgi:hypothetical protein